MANFISICNFPRFESLLEHNHYSSTLHPPKKQNITLEYTAILTKLFLHVPHRDKRFQRQ